MIIVDFIFSFIIRHEGPVWQVAWAHPKHGSMLASCGYDRKVIIWQESEAGWSIFHTYEKHELSGLFEMQRIFKFYFFFLFLHFIFFLVNSIAWAPVEQGLTLACASSDSSVSVLSFKGLFNL